MSLRVKRSNLEDWCTNAYTSRSILYCGVNVPAETGKMSRSDKRGATLPKVAAVATLPRNDSVIMASPLDGGKVAAYHSDCAPFLSRFLYSPGMKYLTAA